MTTRRYWKLLARLGSVALVLLLGAASLSAQEAPKKEPTKKSATPTKRGETQSAKAPEKQGTRSTTGQAGQRAASSGNQPAQRAGTRSSDTRRGASQAQTGQSGQRSETQRQLQRGRPAGNQSNQQGQQAGSNRGATGGSAVRSGAAGRVVTTRSGDAVRRDHAGKVTEVRMRSGAVVYHAPTGVRRVEVARSGGRMVVASAPGRGYVQRQLLFNNRPMVKRTYFMNGVSYARVYRPVTYRGVMFQIYTPVRYYRPSFYGWLFNPWATAVAWNWGWAGHPWYGYYRGYFSPYAYYSSPALWLTDFFIATTLQSAYDERVAAGLAPVPMAGGDVALTPEVKELIAREVRRQIEQERAEGQSIGANSPASDVPVWADNSSHVFVAYTGLAVNSNLGHCTIGEGDVLQLNAVPPPDATAANVVVLASRGRDCRRGSVVAVQLQDLQDMNNRMRETVETGLGDLQARQGQNGIPVLPPGAAGTVDTPLAAEAAPDPNVGTELNQAYRETDEAEQAALGQAGNATAAQAPTISLGQSIEQVRAALGPPLRVMNAGAKQIYIYKDVKITFVNGVVSDIQ